ncbi:MAG TPA: AMP-binding protein [Acidimicrobiales bacterium]|nr:AMP-binding protein [Acidimicrobiales bacterium]
MHERSQMRVAASPGRVWAAITDPAWYASSIPGLSRWEPQSDRLTVGSRVEFRMDIGTAPVGGLLEVVASEPGRRIDWRTVRGLATEGRWDIQPAGNASDVHLTVTYRVPGPLGALMAIAAGPMVRRALAGTLAALRSEVEGATGVPIERPAPPAPVRLGPLGVAATLARAGLFTAATGAAAIRSGVELSRTGITPAGAYVFGAARFADRPAVIDEKGSLTFAEMDRRVRSLAGSLSRRGVSESDRVAVMCRNHRGFVESVAALSRIGADVILLNTSLAAPQVASVVERERVACLIADAEFLPLMEGIPLPRVVATDGRRDLAVAALTDLDGQPTGPVPRPGRPGTHYVLLTSGTTSEPKSASRPVPLTLDPVVGFVDRVPMRVGDTTLIASPMFHALGFGQLSFAWLLSATIVLRPTFDPEAVLKLIARHHIEVLVVVPAMVSQLVELPADVRGRYDTSSLRVAVCSGAALRGDLAVRFMDIYGDVLYNLYGSTEAAFATVARPQDLRAAPGTVGRPLRGVTVRVRDSNSADLPAGVTGRILVGGPLAVQDGKRPSPGADLQLMPTGDLGHFDVMGRLHVDSREDDMIISGGENVYPQPIEDILMTHPAITDAAVIGVPDPRYGERVVAFIVPGPGPRTDSDDIRRYLRQRLPRYMVPRQVVFVDSIPHNGMGKPLHRVLRQALGGPPDFPRTPAV